MPPWPVDGDPAQVTGTSGPGNPASRLQVTVLDDYQRAALAATDWSPVTAAAEVDVVDRHIGDGAELAARLAGSDVLVLMRERTAVRRDLLDRLPRLQLIVTTGPFNAAIDVAAAAERGVVVCGTGGRIEPTVELTWALILGLARHLVEEDRAVRDGRWQTTIGTDLAGATLGLLGLGRIGSRVAAVGTAFGMSTVAWSQNLDRDRAASLDVEAVSKEELFSRSDVVSVHLVLSERTVGVVGRRELAAMRPTALLVNTSRGPIVDEAALVDALRQGRIAGAALDTYGEEPLPADSPLRSAPNTLLTPHIGYVTRGLYARFYRDVVDDIVAFMAGAPIRVVAPPG